MRKLLPVLILIALLLTPLYPVYAEESSTTSANTESRSAAKSLKDRLETARAKLNTRRDHIASREAQIKSKKEELKSLLRGFRDQKKASLVDRINETLARINKNRTDEMSKHLEILSMILSKIDNRAKDSSASAESKTQVESLIASASASISTAKTVVEAQSIRDYTIKISSESAAKADAKIARDNLKKDLDSTHAQVKTARKAVETAKRAFLSLMKGVNNGQ